MKADRCDKDGGDERDSEDDSKGEDGDGNCCLFCHGVCGLIVRSVVL